MSTEEATRGTLMSTEEAKYSTAGPVPIWAMCSTPALRRPRVVHASSTRVGRQIRSTASGACSASDLARSLGPGNTQPGTACLTWLEAGWRVHCRSERQGQAASVVAERKYEIYVSVLTGQATQREAADRDGVDCSTVVTACRVAKQGALDALAAAVPGGPGVSREQAVLEDARAEIGHLDDSKGRVSLLEEMLVGQVVFGQLLSILRRFAEEHHSLDRFGEDRRP